MMVLLASAWLGCHTPNPDYVPPGQEADDASAPTTDSASDSGSETTEPDPATGTSETSGVSETSETSGGPIVDDCPGGGPLTPESLRGVWWMCEFGLNGEPPDDGCFMLDDDAVRFEAVGDANGQVQPAFWNSAPEEGCNGAPGRCFACSHPVPDPPMFIPGWGTWTATSTNEGALEVVVYQEGGRCEAVFSWEPVPEQPYVKVYADGSDGCMLIGQGEPNVPPIGPWFLRKIQQP